MKMNVENQGIFFLQIILKLQFGFIWRQKHVFSEKIYETHRNEFYQQHEQNLAQLKKAQPQPIINHTFFIDIKKIMI